LALPPRFDSAENLKQTLKRYERAPEPARIGKHAAAFPLVAGRIDALNARETARGNGSGKTALGLAGNWQ
jgi:hypothetical protein